MLRVVPARSAAQAKSYYSHSDYYTEDQELAGVWRGKAADRLGLAGTVGKRDFDALCDNRHPASGERVTARDRADRTVGYDFNFHAPKSLSLLHALTGDEAVLRAFQESVDDAMRLVEADMCTRVRKGKVYTDRPTGEMAWARFDHLTSRPVGGVPDPHLHSHCFALNMTFDCQEAQWKAGQFRQLKRDAPYYQAAFHAALAARLTALGYPVDKTPGGWEVAGLARATLEKFSRRTAHIERLAAEKGVDTPAAKAALGATTREAKAKELTMGELRQLWADRLDDGERDALDALAARPGGGEEPAGLDARAALDFACRHLFERDSVVCERRLAAAALDAGLGRFTADQAFAAIRESDVIVREVGGRRLATTRVVLAEEARLVAFARGGRGTCAPLGRGAHAFTRDWLNAGQKAAVRHVLASPDRVMLVRGAAGTGKTSLMQEAAEAIEKGGKRVFAFAPSAGASRGVLRADGFAGADTVARLLVDASLQEQARGQVLWVDEAGLLGSRQTGRLFDLAGKLGCRVVLSGDRRQHGSVERGSVLRVLESQAGLVAAEVREVQRQTGAYKAAVELLADGRAAEGFGRLDALGWVREAADAGRYALLAADYAESTGAGKSCLVVSPTHAEGALATAAVRDALRAAGRLGRDEHAVAQLTRLDLTEAERGEGGSYRPGDVLEFHQNAQGHRIGERVRVREGEPPPVEHAARFQAFRPGELRLSAGDRVRVTKGGKTKDGHRLETGATFGVAGFTAAGDVRLDNGWVVARDFGHLAHGYVTTSHAAQGKTVDRVLVAQSAASLGATSREQFYVSASRGRERVTVYTDDKAALRDAVTRSDAGLAATELVAAGPRPDARRHRLRLNRTAERPREDRRDSHAPERERKEAGRGR